MYIWYSVSAHVLVMTCSDVAQLLHVSKLYARKAWLLFCAIETKSSHQMHRCLTFGPPPPLTQAEKHNPLNCYLKAAAEARMLLQI